MLGSGTRDARRTERYLDGLMAADERHVHDVPVDTDLDPAVRSAARELRAGLNRVHPSFRFEDALAARLAEGAIRLRAGLPIEEAAPASGRGTVSPFLSRSAHGTGTELPAAAPATAPVATAVPAAPAIRTRATWSAAAFRRLPEMGSRSSRPLIVGGVASAAISIGAVYVAWRYSHPASGRMGRAARAAHGRTGHSGQSRRTGVINGILGVVS
jgi:hypothetical protein